MSELPIVAPGYEEEPEVEDVTGLLANRCVVDRETLTEAMDAAMHTPFFRVLRVAEPILMLASLGLLLWSVFDHLGAAPIIRWSFVLAMLLYFYWQQFIRYPKKAVENQLVRQAVDEGTLAPETWLYFKEENIARRRGEAEELLHMPYGNIKRLLETDRLLVIATRRRRLIPLDKAGFENGTAADFLRLIAEKCPKIKQYRKK